MSRPVPAGFAPDRPLPVPGANTLTTVLTLYALLDRVPPLDLTNKFTTSDPPAEDLHVQKARLLENGGLVDFAVREIQASPPSDDGNWTLAETARLYQDSGRFDRAIEVMKPRSFAPHRARELTGNAEVVAVSGRISDLEQQLSQLCARLRAPGRGDRRSRGRVARVRPGSLRPARPPRAPQRRPRCRRGCARAAARGPGQRCGCRRPARRHRR